MRSTIMPFVTIACSHDIYDVLFHRRQNGVGREAIRPVSSDGYPRMRAINASADGRYGQPRLLDAALPAAPVTRLHLERQAEAMQLLRTIRRPPPSLMSCSTIGTTTIRNPQHPRRRLASTDADISNGPRRLALGFLPSDDVARPVRSAAGSAIFLWATSAPTARPARPRRVQRHNCLHSAPAVQTGDDDHDQIRHFPACDLRATGTRFVVWSPVVRGADDEQSNRRPCDRRPPSPLS